MNVRHAMLLTCAVAVVLAPAATRAAAPAIVPPGPVTTDHFGIQVADPYRALEDLDAPSTRAWVDDQATTTRERLQSIPGRQTLLAEYAAIDAQQRPVIPALQAAGPDDTVFYLKRAQGQAGNRLFVKTSDQPERSLSDAADAVAGFAPSPDGGRVVVVATRAGRSGADLSVVDVKGGATTARIADDAWSGAPPRWMPDGSGVYFVAIASAEEAAAASSTRSVLRIRAFRFDGGPVRTVAGWEAAYAPGDTVTVTPSDDGRMLFVAIQGAVTRVLRVVFAKVDASPMSWTPLIDADAEVRAIAVHGSQVFARTMAGATLGRIVRYDATAPARAPVEVVAGSDGGVLQDLVAAADGLYFSTRTAYEMQLARLPYGDRATRPSRVDLPYRGTIKSLAGDTALPGVVLGLEGWTHPVTFLRVRGARVTTLALQEPASAIGSDWVSENLSCRTADGVEVPMVAIHRKDLEKDGRHPLILNGYGAYGFVEPAYFYAKSDPWIQRGGVFVDFMARGSGATGEDWHRAGMGPTKANSWKDLVTCAEKLIAVGYTSPERLVIQGTAIGGLMVGRAMTERPDLFAAAVIRWGITDALRFIESPAHLPADELELGRADSAAGVAQLLDASIDAHLRDDVRYPAVMLTTGLKDQRFPAWMSLKTAARLAATRTSAARPVLLRVDPNGGAMLPMSPEQRNEELADRIAFMLWSVGDPGFQPGR